MPSVGIWYKSVLAYREQHHDMIESITALVILVYQLLSIGYGPNTFPRVSDVFSFAYGACTVICCALAFWHAFVASAVW